MFQICQKLLSFYFISLINQNHKYLIYPRGNSVLISLLTGFHNHFNCFSVLFEIFFSPGSPGLPKDELQAAIELSLQESHNAQEEEREFHRYKRTSGSAASCGVMDGYHYFAHAWLIKNQFTSNNS